MSLHQVDLHRVYLGTVEPANDDYEMVACSWSQAAKAIATFIGGSILMGMIFYSAIAFFGGAA